MDDSWQVKYGSTLQSSGPSMASSALQGSRNRMDVNMADQFYPCFGRDLRSQVHGRVPDPSSSNIPNLISNSLSHTDLGDSFLALLSGPASLLQCDFQELSNPKLFSNCIKPPIDVGSIATGSTGNRNPLVSSWLPSEHVGCQNLQNGAELQSVVSCRPVAGSNYHSNSVLQHGPQAANFCLQTSDPSRAVIQNIVPAIEKIKDFPSVMGEWHGINTKVQNKSNQVPQKRPSEAEPSVSSNLYSLTSGCPRVFCLGTSGDLLLSNTGLLGILCSCHCFHMSVSKFCEHSGLLNANPSDAVRMESGETIAQWRKLYFQKFGIRVPEDQSGWDWPEGLSLTASLVKSGVTMPNMSKNSDLNHLTGPSGGLARLPDNITYLKNSLADQNQYSDALHSKQQRNGVESGKFLSKGFVGTFGNSQGLGDSQIIDCPTSVCSTKPKDVARGPEVDCQSTSGHIDAILKTRGLSTSHPTLCNLRTLVKHSDVSRSKDMKDGLTGDKTATSSSIELRLGQPYQQSQISGNPALSAVGPRLYNGIVDLQNSSSQEQIIHSATRYRGDEKSGPWLPCASSRSNSTLRKEHELLNCGNSATSNMDDAKIEMLKGNVAETSVASLLRHFNTLPQKSSYYKSTDDVVHIGNHIMPEKLNSEFHTVKCDPINATWKVGNDLETRRTVPELGFLRYMDKGKKVGCVSGSSYPETDLGSKIHRRMENPISFVGASCGNSDSCIPALHDMNCNSHHLSSVPPDGSNPGNISSYFDKVPYLGNVGHIEHAFLRSMELPSTSEQILKSHAVPIGFSLTSSTSIPGLTPTLLKQESNLLDDNLKLLVLKQILELSRPQHVMSSLEKNQEQWRCDDLSAIKLQHSLVEPSRSGEQRHGPDLINKHDVTDNAMKSVQSLPAGKMVSDVDKVTPMTGFNNCCSFSAFTQGMSSKYKEIDMQYQLSHDARQNELSSLRLGRSEDVVYSNGQGNCCQRKIFFQDHCSCAAHTKCFGGRCQLTDGNHLKQNAISLDLCGKLKGQLCKKINCCSSQWKDVPRQVKGIVEMACVNGSANLLDGRGHELNQLGDNAAKWSNGASHVTESFKGQKMSSISSGCSTPAVTQASIEVNNIDSSTVVAGNTECTSDLIVDEGSGNNKCWLSDDSLESERSADFYGSTCMTSLRKEGPCKPINNQSSRSLLDEVKLMDSLTWKRGRNQIQTGVTIHGETNHSAKKRREMKMTMLDASLGPEGFVGHDKYPKCKGTSKLPCLSKDAQTVSSGPEMSHISGSKCGKSTLSMSKIVSHKRDLHRLYDERNEKDDRKTKLNDNANSYKTFEALGRKKSKSTVTSDGCMLYQTSNSNLAVGVKTLESDSLSIKAYPREQVNVCYKKAKPVVCGEYGEICDGNTDEDMLRHVKFASLDRILKTTKRYMLNRNGKPKVTLQKDLKRTSSSCSNASFDKLSDLKKEEENGSSDALGKNMNLHHSMEERGTVSVILGKQSADAFQMLVEKRDVNGDKGCSTVVSNAHAQSKPKFKEIRKRSLYELTLNGKISTSEMLSNKKVFQCSQNMKVRKVIKSSRDTKRHMYRSCKVNAKRYVQEEKHFSAMAPDSFCCVCGSSNNDEINRLLDCSRCLIRVHQACYGVSKVPNSHWYCRPCRTSSENVVCVLCGYGGGAMTRAVQSHTIVKSILKAWNLETDCKLKDTICDSNTREDELNMSHPSGSVVENNSYPVLRHINIEPPTSAVSNTDTKNQINTLRGSLRTIGNLKLHNSITAGVLDSTIKQWVHMVCGLWTPGTRCPNVDTMSAFDVSGVSHPRANMVCSICNRPGGSCIQCRVVNCSVPFHPWCAHQKGLLQSEVEGVDNESVGFYGRCELHAMYQTNESVIDVANTDTGCQGEKDVSCARTEGYKGRKRDGFWHNLNEQSKGQGGCLVPQEQLNAWVHINGQRTFAQGLSKLPISDMGHDCRKEYARYKQAKSWKHLVVYKSGIHALGLYTSRFISRGEMVVEYIGEIVGLRVADKREIEYQSGRKLQYKSACYFFRIDKEHIIDATRKGGIARFVNHSCLPNCVAKVISVRNEKKVVFFAERDIYPGEEITYDYHFNHEDEDRVADFASSFAPYGGDNWLDEIHRGWPFIANM